MGYITEVRFSPTLDTAVYAANDVLFSTTPMQAGVKSGTIRGLTIIDKDDLGENCDLYFLNASTSIGTANSAPNITDVVAENIIGIMSGMSASKDIGGVRVASYEFSLSFDVQGGGILYVAGITNTALQHTANGVVFTFRIERS